MEKGLKLNRLIAGIIITPLILAYGICSFVIATKEFYGKKFPSFLVYSNRMVSMTKRDLWEGMRKGLEPLDVVLEVNGKNLASGRELYKEAKKADVLNLTVKKNKSGEISKITVSPSVFSSRDYSVLVLIPFISASIFLILGTIVYFVKKFDSPSTLFYALSSSISLFYFSHINSNFVHIFSFPVLLYPVFGAIGVHLFGVFPVEFPSQSLNKKAIYGIYGIAFILAILNGISYFSLKFPVINKISVLFMGLIFLFIVTLLFYRLREVHNHILRRKIRVLIFTILSASFTSAVWAIVFPFQSIGITTDVQMLLSLIFPILMTYATFKYNVFNMDRVVRIGVSFFFLTGVLTAVYFLAVLLVILMGQHVFKIGYSPTHLVIGTLAVAMLFHPLRLGIKKFLAKTLYKEELKLRDSLLSFCDNLQIFHDFRYILRKAVRLFEGELGFNRVAVYAKESTDDNFHDISLEVGTISHPLSKEIVAEINSHPFSKANVPVLINPESSDPIERKLHSEGIKLILPLTGRNWTPALFLLGERFEGETWTKEDINVFKTFSKTLGLIIENSIIYAEMLRKERLAVVGEMASLIIHEIKNPVGIISVSFGTLSKIVKEKDEKVQELLSIVNTEINRINMILKKILTYAKYSPPVFEKRKIDEIINLTVDAVKPVAQENNIEILVHEEEPIPPTLLDGEKIQILFQNLLLNSIESIEKNGKIEVIIKKEKLNKAEKIIVEIKDTGKGIPPGMEKEIFKPFFSTKQGGTGLGLAICERIVKDHYGEIECFNNETGGATFIIKLPVRSENG
jgi:signal transduction histidine kinase